MKNKLIFSVLCLFIFMGSFAQEVANLQVIAPVISPEIKEKEVIFRIFAPKADTINLYGSWMEKRTSYVSLTKDHEGLWSVSIPVPSPEFYTYNFIVDGVSVSDPGNIRLRRGGVRYQSVLLIPGEISANYFEANQRGNLSSVWYDSPTLGMNRRMFVYTPYGYDSSKDKYPVLYLLHGGGGDEEQWSTMGRACQILDNLIEKKLALPMIVVMPNGYPAQVAAKTLMIPEKVVDTNNPAYADSYVNSLVKDIVPYIEKNYKVIAKPGSRAIAGLSMGAGHTIRCTNLYPGFFSYICPLSNGIKPADVYMSEYDDRFKAINKAGYKLYFLAIGSDDALYEPAKTLDAALTRNGLKHTFYVNSGGHTWYNWRIYLNIFVPMLFK